MSSYRFRLGATAPPVVDGDPAKALAARTLHPLLLGVLLWLVLYFAAAPLAVERKAAGSGLAGALMLSVLTSLFYLSKGRVKLASWIILSSLWFVWTIITLFSGGIESRGLIFFIAISVAAAWLLGQRVALISAGLLAGMTLALALLEHAGTRMPKYFPGSPLAVWMMLLLFMAIAMLPMNQVLRALHDAVEQANQRVADLKRRELALQAIEERCRLAMEAGRMFAFEWNPATDEVQRSADSAAIYGVNGNATREKGKNTVQRIHPDDREAIVDTVKTLTPTEDSYKAEYRVFHSSGKIVWVQQSARALFDSTGRMVRLIGITGDITERKQAEEALRESEERFRRVFEEGPLGLALVGKDYRFVKVNNSFCRMVGYSESELLQMTFAEITHPDDLQADVDLAERLFKGEIPFFQLQKRYLKKNGEIIWIRLTASILRDQEGEPVHGLGMIEDITEFKRIQEEALARQKLESLGILASGVAHDFNNLLGGILAEAECVEANLSEGSSPIEELGRIKKGVIRGAQIVRQLLIYAGQDQASQVEPVELSQLVEEMLDLLKISISKHAVLKTNLDKSLPAVWCSASQIRQVLMNLVINASEAIGEKEGVIQVATSRVNVGQDLQAYNVAKLPPGEYLRLHVSDTGCGVTEEMRAKIFDPFFTTKFAGRGLGLAFVQGFVRDHGGVVNVESGPGQGATFQILLPCNSEKGLDGRAVLTFAGAERSVARSVTILVVEDEDLLRVAVSKLLRKKGLTVLEASDGSAAIDLIRARADELDVVLLDVTLPGPSSREILEQAVRIRPEIKVILTSAYSREAVSASFAELPAEHFIRKPFQFAELMSLLEDTLSA